MKAGARHDRGTLIVTIDNPPVNALGVDVRRGISQAIAGADIREFGKPRTLVAWRSGRRKPNGSINVETAPNGEGLACDGWSEYEQKTPRCSHRSNAAPGHGAVDASG